MSVKVYDLAAPNPWGLLGITPVLPDFYWDVYSEEQRIKTMCLAMDGTIQYTSQLAEGVNAEEDARKTADTTLQANIDNVSSELATETTNRTNADNALGTRIDNEVAARQSADTALGDRIDSTNANLAQETTDRTSADNALGTRIDTETQARIDGDDALGKRIDSTDANLAKEVSDRSDADSALGSRIDAETQARTEADSALDTRITTLDSELKQEIQDRTDGDTALGSRIDTETQARIDGDKKLQDQIDSLDTSLKQEISDRTSGDATLQTNIDKVSGDLTSEVSARESADSTLQGNIDTEKARAEAAETALGERIDKEHDNYDAEQAARIETDTQLWNAVNKNKADIATNTTNIESNTTNITQEIQDRKDADAALQEAIENADNVFVVNFEVNSDYSATTATTESEIAAAVDAGKVVLAKCKGTFTVTLNESSTATLDVVGLVMTLVTVDLAGTPPIFVAMHNYVIDGTTCFVGIQLRYVRNALIYEYYAAPIAPYQSIVNLIVRNNDLENKINELAAKINVLENDVGTTGKTYALLKDNGFLYKETTTTNGE